MRPIILFLVLAGIGIITWLIIARPGKTEDGPKQQALAVSKHSESFNTNFTSLLNDYYKLSEEFVNWDSASAAATSASLIKGFDNLVLDELKKDDSLIYLTAVGIVDNAKGNLQTIVSEKNIRQQREAFNYLTDNLNQLINTIKYDREKLYLQECPMAFDDTQSAQWISKSGEDKDRRNPYLGLKDPKYGSGMLKCGETKHTINHTGKE